MMFALSLVNAMSKVPLSASGPRGAATIAIAILYPCPNYPDATTTTLLCLRLEALVHGALPGIEPRVPLEELPRHVLHEPVVQFREAARLREQRRGLPVPRRPVRLELLELRRLLRERRVARRRERALAQPRHLRDVRRQRAQPRLLPQELPEPRRRRGAARRRLSAEPQEEQDVAQFLVHVARPVALCRSQRGQHLREPARERRRDAEHAAAGGAFIPRIGGVLGHAQRRLELLQPEHEVRERHGRRRGRGLRSGVRVRARVGVGVGVGSGP
mmetsp:Transcript_29273/g.93830  ORF Transcript_29273/g.93830 Transcript_29273/m.93830 type:complete len:273 (-) Transcript_29273:53-871(-)